MSGTLTECWYVDRSLQTGRVPDLAAYTHLPRASTDNSKTSHAEIPLACFFFAAHRGRRINGGMSRIVGVNKRSSRPSPRRIHSATAHQHWPLSRKHSHSRSRTDCVLQSGCQHLQGWTRIRRAGRPFLRPPPAGNRRCRPAPGPVTRSRIPGDELGGPPCEHYACWRRNGNLWSRDVCRVGCEKYHASLC